MSIYEKDLFGVSKHDQSIKWIQLSTQGLENVICAFSGGKDSQCCYHLMKEAGINFRAVYTITRFEPPELLRFIRQNYPEVEIIRNFKRSLTDDIAIFGLPNRWYRWCCGVKHDHYPIPFDLKVIGVRWEEKPTQKRDLAHLWIRQKPDGIFMSHCKLDSRRRVGISGHELHPALRTVRPRIHAHRVRNVSPCLSQEPPIRYGALSQTLRNVAESRRQVCRIALRPTSAMRG